MPTPIPNMISWPLGSVDEDGRLDWSRDDKSVRDVMLNILLTCPGERIMRPDFGAGLLNFVHQPNNETTRNLIAGVVRKSLAQWEPRVVVSRVDVSPSPTNLAEVHIVIHYRLRHNQTPAELNVTLTLGNV
jgi:phage baseplate assembly protein W